jgi:hypothetical protein
LVVLISKSKLDAGTGQPKWNSATDLVMLVSILRYWFFLSYRQCLADKTLFCKGNWHKSINELRLFTDIRKKFFNF